MQSKREPIMIVVTSMCKGEKRGTENFLGGQGET